MDDFPLFVLGMVAVPHEAVPLHVFEERYRAMIGECLERDTEFGIVWSHDGAERATGCACAIEEVLQRHEDGRLDILSRGTRPFRVIERHDDRPWPAATVAFLDDASETADPKAAAAARGAYARLVRDATDEEPEADRLAAMGAYEMAATVELTNPAKQELLELRSENARLSRVSVLIDDAMRRFAVRQVAAESARTNGHVRHD